YNLTFVGGDISEDNIRQVFEENGDENPVIQWLGQNETRWVINNPTIEATDSDAVIDAIQSAFQASSLDGNLAVSYTESIGYLLNFTNDTFTEANIRPAFESLLGEGAS